MGLAYNSAMRIDPVLCQKILIAVESDPQSGSGQFIRISLDDYVPTEVAQHIKYLWDEKLVTGSDVTNYQSPYTEILLLDITPAGRRYLDERDSEAPQKPIGF
jgi:hypothetical protein